MFRYFKFKLNDTVQFAEKDGHMYRIVGYRLEKGFYPKDEWTHIIYELLREFDGYTMDAEEEELVKEINDDIKSPGLARNLSVQSNTSQHDEKAFQAIKASLDAIHDADFDRLEPEVYLNDNLINFYLK